jgi:hypothetical protein
MLLMLQDIEEMKSEFESRFKDAGVRIVQRRATKESNFEVLKKSGRRRSQLNRESFAHDTGNS